jgi:uncharacterized phage protein gp47/JayE
MPIDETSLKDLETQCLANKESRLAVTIPLAPRSFLRVESVVMAGSLKSLEKRAVYGQKECLAAAAMREGLRAIGRDYDIDIEPATKASFTCRATASPGDSVSFGAELTSNSTGAYYNVIEGGTESGGYVSFVVEATDAGEAANLDEGEELTFTSSTGRTSGVGDVAEIMDIEVTAEDEEDIEDFRRRVLNEQRKTSGGGNNSDYRDWAEDVSGVERAFPYSGKPITWKLTNAFLSFDAATKTINNNDPENPGIFEDDAFGTLGIGDMVQIDGSDFNDGFFTVRGVSADIIYVWETVVDEAYGADVTIANASQPGDRTVFVESVDNDGIPTEDLLEAVREGINFNEAGEQNPGLGDVDSCLYVEPVTRTTFDIEIYNLRIDVTQEDAAKARVEEDIDTYFQAAKPFLEGLDFEFDRADMITITALAKVVQSVLTSYGASADFLIVSVDSDVVTSYQLGQGELAKLGTVTWTETEE